MFGDITKVLMAIFKEHSSAVFRTFPIISLISLSLVALGRRTLPFSASEAWTLSGYSVFLPFGLGNIQNGFWSLQVGTLSLSLAGVQTGWCHVPGMSLRLSSWECYLGKQLAHEQLLHLASFIRKGLIQRTISILAFKKRNHCQELTSISCCLCWQGNQWPQRTRNSLGPLVSIFESPEADDSKLREDNSVCVWMHIHRQYLWCFRNTQPESLAYMQKLQGRNSFKRNDRQTCSSELDYMQV